MTLIGSIVTIENNQSKLDYQDKEMDTTIYLKTFHLTAATESNIFRLANNVVLGALVAVFGIFSNIINMIVFRKQGFTTTVNISFFALALSDLLCLVTYEGSNVFVNPLMEQDYIPLVPVEFQYLIVGWFHVCFGRVTSWITVYITGERCLSVALPLKVKQIVSPRRTTVAMCAIFVINITTLIPEYYIGYLDWKFVPERNKTLIGIVYRSFRKDADGVAFILTSISGMLSFISVIILTSFLTIKLTQKSGWRINASSNNAQSEARSLRDKKTIKMVVVIASVLIICYTPGTIASLVTVFEPEFIISGTYGRIFLDTWSLCFICGAINSSVNMFLYYNMSTKYRETFNQLFSNCMRYSTDK